MCQLRWWWIQDHQMFPCERSLTEDCTHILWAYSNYMVLFPRRLILKKQGVRVGACAYVRAFLCWHALFTACLCCSGTLLFSVGVKRAQRAQLGSVHRSCCITFSSPVWLWGCGCLELTLLALCSVQHKSPWCLLRHCGYKIYAVCVCLFVCFFNYYLKLPSARCCWKTTIPVCWGPDLSL